jgi:hypothetical protein
MMLTRAQIDERLEDVNNWTPTWPETDPGSAKREALETAKVLAEWLLTSLRRCEECPEANASGWCEKGNDMACFKAGDAARKWLGGAE